MAESHVASALRHKRGEIAGDIVVAERRITELRAALVHVDATLKLFAGDDANPEAIPPRISRTRSDNLLPAPVGARGSLVRAVLDVLRKADGNLTAPDVAERAGIALGISAEQARTRKSPFRSKIEGTLYRQRDRGVVIAMKDGMRTIWRVAD